MAISARHERPVIFTAGGEELFGILTRPEGGGNGLTVLTLFGAGPFPTLGKNQVRVRMARRLADLGFHVLRIDYRGVGESGGECREADLAEPWVDDVVGAVDWLQSQGLHRIVMVGVCFGARSALAAADRIPALAGMALIAPPVGQANHREAILEHSLAWYARRATKPGALRLLTRGEAARRRRRMLQARVKRALLRRPSTAVQPRKADASPEFLTAVRSLLDAEVPMLFLYGRTDDFFPNFERALEKGLGRMIERAGHLVDVRIVDREIAGLASVETQEMLLGTIADWAASLARHEGSKTRGGRGGFWVE